MADEHFSHEVILRFFRSELSRHETRDFVRHLLKRCIRCSHLLQQAARAQSLGFLVRGVEITGSGLHQESRQEAVREVLRLAERKEPGPAQGEPGGSGIAIASASSLRGRMPWTRISTG